MIISMHPQTESKRRLTLKPAYSYKHNIIRYTLLIQWVNLPQKILAQKSQFPYCIKQTLYFFEFESI